MLELLIVSPAFVLCVGVSFFSKNRIKAEKVVDWIVKYLKWPISIVFWITLLIILQ